MKKIGIIFTIAFLFLLLDQASKIYALNFLQTGNVLVEDFFILQYAENPGIAFSIALPHFLIVILNIILLLAISFFAAFELDLGKKRLAFGVGLLLAGGLGNLTDRLFRDGVIDFISIWKWPSFNLADTFIVTGILLIIIFYAKIKRNKPYSYGRKN